MPRLPTSEPFRQPNPVLRSGDGGLDPTGRALSGVGDAIAQIGEQRKRSQDAIDLSLARSKYLEAHVKTVQSLSNRDDWDQYEKVYNEAMATARDEAASLIHSPDARDAFVNEIRVTDVKRRAEVFALSEATRIDTGKAALVNTLLSTRVTALDAPSEATAADAVAVGMTAIEDAREAGLVSAEDAAKMRDKYRRDIAVDRIEAMPAEERIKALRTVTEGSFASYLTSTEREKLRSDAQREIYAEEAHRREEQRFEWSQQDRAERLVREKAMDYFQNQVNDLPADQLPGMTFEEAVDLSNPDWDKLPLSSQDALRRYFNARRNEAIGAVTKEAEQKQREVVTNLWKLAREDPRGFATYPLWGARSAIPDEEFRRLEYAQKQLRADHFESRKALVDAKIAQLNLDEDQAAQFSRMVFTTQQSREIRGNFSMDDVEFVKLLDEMSGVAKSTPIPFTLGFFRSEVRGYEAQQELEDRWNKLPRNIQQRLIERNRRHAGDGRLDTMLKDYDMILQQKKAREQLVETRLGEEFDRSWQQIELHHEKNLSIRQLLGDETAADDGESTVANIMVEIEGRHYVIPSLYWSVKKGAFERLSRDAAVKRAKEIGLEKFPAYETADQAMAAEMEWRLRSGLGSVEQKEPRAYSQKQSALRRAIKATALANPMLAPAEAAAMIWGMALEDLQ